MSPAEQPTQPSKHELSGSIRRESIVQWSSAPVSAAVGNEVVLMNLDRGRCYGLGPVGTDLWNKLSEPIQVADVLRQLLQEYSAEPEVLEHDVIEVLEQYAAEGLIVVSAA